MLVGLKKNVPLMVYVIPGEFPATMIVGLLSKEEDISRAGDHGTVRSFCWGGICMGYRNLSSHGIEVLIPQNGFYECFRTIQIGWMTTCNF